MLHNTQPKILWICELNELCWITWIWFVKFVLTKNELFVFKAIFRDWFKEHFLMVTCDFSDNTLIDYFPFVCNFSSWRLMKLTWLDFELSTTKFQKAKSIGEVGETGVEPTCFFHMAIKSVCGMLARIFKFMWLEWGIVIIYEWYNSHLLTFWECYSWFSKFDEGVGSTPYPGLNQQGAGVKPTWQVNDDFNAHFGF